LWPKPSLKLKPLVTRQLSHQPSLRLWHQAETLLHKPLARPLLREMPLPLPLSLYLLQLLVDLTLMPSPKP
jgi:hypothetical protein